MSRVALHCDTKADPLQAPRTPRPLKAAFPLGKTVLRSQEGEVLRKEVPLGREGGEEKARFDFWEEKFMANLAGILRVFYGPTK